MKLLSDVHRKASTPFFIIPLVNVTMVFWVTIGSLMCDDKERTNVPVCSLVALRVETVSDELTANKL